MSQTTDHFNFPNASRKDTMYLSTIRPAETGFAQHKFERNTFTKMEIGDIDKARPYYPGYQFTNKESFINRIDDIPGTHPKKLHQPLNKEYYYLKNEDIRGSKPQQHKFVTTREPTNPLNPAYKLPHVEIRQPSPPKFIRDGIDIKDIDGARPNPYYKYNIERKNLTVDDIDGARPKKEWIPQGKPSTLNVKDINFHWEFHSNRVTDPLSPRYKVVDENKALFDYGKIDNKPIIRHPQVVHKEAYALQTQDIDGAQAGASTKHFHKISTRDDLLKTQDIPGAQIATLKKGMTTIRHVNPLVPEYRNPGHSEPPPVYDRNYTQYKGGPTQPTRARLSATGQNIVSSEQPTGLANIGGGDGSHARARSGVEKFDKFITK